ncbi:hypothetical protein H6G54_28115 [Anabaena cylindrica FACHB-243]|uniref:SPOR domain-containing protein n=1 Tax=Anabaena cylindrica (strain ATCC 27899 / PCC 7122) TaxID=272123 RepID=K9ZE92_ANACC|nr:MULTISPECIES: hypothetical protein [Anabaena]AFZ57054.1 hypothetical protein Anacy_1548 [Anabaena cylindrica PCC 7122]MBD2421474.1 hypothetical protein [Anabaena cylindrica FACHB-243]MBY5284665.1 hypothetical protein [Anabaena sp. CCAP 1446/1C]MBY5311406.1 hypothetical protein [Anabaena sp. CCAP 1446/1C]MCM2407765.1 hypothetical protein [Anabaena sp. CCAP 1446/1C]
MSQNPIIDSGTQPPNQSGLKPVLATALASLEVQLDQELTRYRRTRSGFRPPKQVGVETYMSNQPQQNGTTATLEKTQSAVEVNTNPIPQQSPSPEIDKQAEIDHLHLSSSQESSKTETPADATSISSIVPTKAKASEHQVLLPAEDTSKQPDDYLESSEALLRSLTEEQAPIKKSSNSSDSLLSPLGIGSMLLLLLASLTLGYVVFNPKTLPQLNLSKLFNVTSSSNTVNPEITESNTPPIAVPEITPIPKYPNLATREFPEVKDPNDVVGLKPKVQPTPTAIPQAIAVQTPKNPVIPQTSVPPVPPVTPTPQPQSTATSPTLNEEIQPSSDGFYYVVVDNQGAGALTAARQVVPDAYLSPNQKYIYLGALKTKEEVKLRLQQLKAKGINASVQK